MRLTINKIDFEIESVPADIRRAVEADPIVRQGLRREIFAWDREAGKGRMIARTVKDGAIPLGNALTFFVPRVGSDGTVSNNDKLAQKNAERFLAAVGARDVLGVLRPLARVLPLPRVGLPRERFRPFDKAVNYTVVMETEFATVRLREASRNLTAYLFVPAQVFFRAEVAEEERPALQKLMEEKPSISNRRFGTILPEANAANRDIRRLATAQRIRDLQPAVTAAREAGTPPEPAVADAFGRAVREWRMLVPQDAT
ncbi:hypothetical protein SAMN05444417_2561 [Wenxinia saemankumensis]|uniref:Uncharacterized protein n=2 Tax=Wenxinia saemankumensis TaxID=1447782 RepID=A0A1M6FY16_9RHOB|nr:hypothetical protein SAMN05444417_2561 [Wenxinia saemankumensis]